MFWTFQNKALVHLIENTLGSFQIHLIKGKWFQIKIVWHIMC